jgi:transcriptional regulator with XRE-family HTH domain
MMPQDPATGFGSALRQALREKGMKQSALAHELPVDPGQISRWVNGRAMPSPSQVRLMEGILEADLSEALADSTPEHELFIASPVGGLDPDNIAEHLADVAKVLEAAREQVNGIYWPSEGDTTASDRTYVAADIRTERNLRVLNNCPALLFLQFAEVVRPSSAYIELGFALGKRMSLTIMVKRGLMLPYMLHRFGMVGTGLKFLPRVRIYTDEIASADDAAALIATNGRELLGLS